jgi:protein-tyrosine phosphatase
MAESVLKAALAAAGLSGEVAVDSAGTGGWHVGEGADPRTVRVLEDRGYSSRHIARRLERGDFAERELMLALDSGHLRTLRSRAPDGSAAELRLLREFDPAAPAGRLDVPDPYYGTLAGFESCLAMVESAMPGLVRHIEKALETRTV